MKLRRAIVAAALLLMTSLPSASPGSRQPAEQRPSRIISAIPAVTEMLFAIGARPQVVAVGSFDNYPPEIAGLARVGALIDPDLEKMLALRPDLVVVYDTQVDLRRQLERARIPVFRYRHAGLADVTATVRELGARVGRPAAAEAVAADIERSLAAIRTRVAGLRPPRTLVVFGREKGALRGIYASGGVGFIHDMVEAAGGTNIFADVRRESVQATSELILARSPDVILELNAAPISDGEQAAERGVWQVLSAVPAVRNHRIHMIGDERTVIPGPRVAQGTQLIARALHPDRFK
ncbi:MAG: ABC transporter substrate-binding protein [Acidobacteria bacterium]|nr:ABC transporter substrate-binding protein [Acidobacteriota bacterium]MCA1650667.1 ABC transporter substrate-binding protein [Acidobacteriota bacterium]